MAYTYEYPRPAVTVDAIIVSERKSEMVVLLIMRKFPPYEGKWALPGGFVNIDETLHDACKRELFEETGLENTELKQFYTFDAVGRDPRHRTISVIFNGWTDEPVHLTGRDDAMKADWFPIISLPEMAFDHAEIIAKFVREKL
jgi:8-oxo-dGTP diphosphatase